MVSLKYMLKRSCCVFYGRLLTYLACFRQLFIVTINRSGLYFHDLLVDIVSR